MEVIKPPLSIEQFRVSLALIKAGDTIQFEQLQQYYILTIEQYNTLSEAHEHAIKSIQ